MHKKKVLAIGISLLLAASSLSGSGHCDVINNTLSPELEPHTEPPKLIDDPEFLEFVHKLNPDLKPDTLNNIATYIEKYGQKYDVPINLIVAVIATESRFHPEVKGALDDTGLMQIRLIYTPYWAKMIGIKAPKTRDDLLNIDTNIHIGTYILSNLLEKYNNNLEQVIVAYNAGTTYVDKRIKNSAALPKRYFKEVNDYHVELCNAPISLP